MHAEVSKKQKSKYRKIKSKARILFISATLMLLMWKMWVVATEKLNVSFVCVCVCFYLTQKEYLSLRTG